MALPPVAWQIRQGVGVHAAGRSMFTVQDIAKGSLILEDNPLMICDTRKRTKWVDVADAWWARERARGTDIIIQAYAQLSQPAQVSFGQLHRRVAGASSTLSRKIDRMEQNAFNFEVGAQNQVHLVVFNNISAINHSCVPNATVDIFKGEAGNPRPRGQGRLIATKDILRGSEILINYTPDRWLDDPATRGAVLHDQWHFDCTCPGCDPAPNAQMDATERASARIYHETLLAPAANLTLQEIDRHILRLHTYIDLLNSLGHWEAELSLA
jgi:hypothetical protein